MFEQDKIDSATMAHAPNNSISCAQSDHKNCPEQRSIGIILGPFGRGFPSRKWYVGWSLFPRVGINRDAESW